MVEENKYKKKFIFFLNFNYRVRKIDDLNFSQSEYIFICSIRNEEDTFETSGPCFLNKIRN